MYARMMTVATKSLILRPIIVLLLSKVISKNLGSKYKIWKDNISKLNKGFLTRGKVINKVSNGYLVKLDCGLEAILENNKITNNKVINLYDVIEVMVIKIDMINKQIFLSF